MRHAISYNARTWNQWPSIQEGSREIAKRIEWARKAKRGRPCQ